jgi:5-methylcytosine-specific restriction endonuclease McrA
MIDRINYYQQNKDKWKKYYEKRKTDPQEKRKYNEIKRKWRHGVGKTKDKISKQKSDKKYYNKIKNNPDFKLKKKLYMQEYHSRPKVKERRKQVETKYYSRPEIKKHRAEYNKKLHQDNPDMVLKNTRKHLQKIGAFHNLRWHQMLDQLRGWAEIIHKDCDETCQICFAPSQEAHHIFHKSKYPQLAFNRNNGIALCTKCHNEAHGKMLINNPIQSPI